MKSQFYKMNQDELLKALGEEKMSIVPKKYHGPELKCGGVGMCSDCTERQKKGIPMESPLKTEKPDVKCSCSARELFWNGCQCQPGKGDKKISIKF